MVRAGMALALALLAVPALAGPWFQHEFGERRAYFRDWLAVCADNGRGPCRAVHMAFEPGDSPFFGSARLSVQEHGADGYTIEVFDKQLPPTPQGPITLVFDGSQMVVQPDQLKAGSPEGHSVSQTFSITDPELTETLIQAMRKSDRMDLKAGGVQRRFSMMGISKTLDAIERERRKRQK